MPDNATRTNTDAPPKLAVDANGYCWRVFPEGWSMARTNPDNSPVPEPITYYEPVDPDANTEAEQDALKLGMVKAERDALRDKLRDLKATL